MKELSFRYIELAIRTALEEQEREYITRMGLSAKYDRVRAEKRARKVEEVEAAMVKKLLAEFMPSDYLDW